MSNTFDANLKTELAKNFVQQFGPFSNDKFYVAISRISGNGLEVRTESEELTTRNNTVLAKRVNPQDGAAVLVERNDWTSGTVYDRLNNETDMSTASRPFYAMTNEQNVYICLDNAGGNTGSSIQPSGTSTDTITLADGYSWKFLFSVPQDKLLFLDENFIPVDTLPTYPRIANAYNDNRQNQYAVQYEGSVDSKNGTIQAVSIISEPPLTLTDAFPESPSNILTAVGDDSVVIEGRPVSGSTNTVSLNGYYIRILSGVASGEVRRIRRGTGDTLTLTENWTTGKKPKAGDRFEIGPGITISGDGQNAKAFGKVGSNGKISNIVVYVAGSGYTTASGAIDASAPATGVPVSGSLTDTDKSNYTFDVLLFSPIGQDPAVELLAKHAAFLVRLSGSNSAESAILGNDFRDVVLWKNPEIGTGYSNSGKIAGFDDTLTTRVIIQEPSETGNLTELQNLSETSDSIIVVGEDSNIAAEINNHVITIDQNKVTGNFRAIDVRRPFIEDEILTFIGRRDGSYTESDKTAKAYVTRYPDSDLSVSKEVYTCTTRLNLSFPTGGDYTPSLDAGATGASGSSGLIAKYVETSSAGDRATLSLTDIKNISGVTMGFSDGETITYPLASGALVTGTILADGVNGPELDLFSGQMPYIQGLTQGIVRVVEQDEVFKFVFEF